MTTLADQAIQMSKPNCANFSRASLTVRITFPEVRNRKGTESGLMYLTRIFWKENGFSLLFLAAGTTDL